MTPLDQKGKCGVAPYLGQHTREVMLELGYDDQKISDFYKDKIIF
jgi:crotonobetainyl-CoA:carnitine CoA-transferase CaiB-like acyl-CoA transferase